MNPIRIKVTGVVVILLLFCFGTVPLSIRAQAGFNADCKKAYELLFQYDLAGADKIIEAEKSASPGSLAPLYLESYHDLLKVFFSEYKFDYERMQKAEDERETMLKKSNVRSPYKYFFLSEVYIHDAIVRAKFGDRISAAYKIKSAYSLLKQCNKEYPKFLPARKNLFIMEGAIGTLPVSYRVVLSILGFHGNLKQSAEGYRQYLLEVDTSREYKIFSRESRVFYAFMDYYLLNRPADAWQQMQLATADYEKSRLSTFFRATMALRTRHNAEASACLVHYAIDPKIMQLNYLYGIARLQQLDPQGGYYLSRYIRQFIGEGYIKDAYMKMGWAFLLKGDTGSYRNCQKLVVKYGSTRFEEDKNALKEASRKPLPDMHLLKARLLYDGGLYQRAQAELEPVAISSFRTNEERAESQYRLGRIYEGLNDDKKAIQFYNTVVKNYPVPRSYYPAASCLYIGMIYEKQKNVLLARQYFLMCLKYSDYPYEDSFNQKANAGLKRLE